MKNCIICGKKMDYKTTMCTEIGDEKCEGYWLCSKCENPLSLKNVIGGLEVKNTKQREMKDRKVEFWDDEGTEILNFTDKDEAIEYILDGIGELPAKLEICGYTRREMTESAESLGDSVLDDLLERLDDEYGGEDETERTDEMKKSATIFANKMLSLYSVWQCEIVKKEIIDVNEWVKENRPDWLVNKNNE